MTPREQEIQRRTELSETRVVKAVFPPTTNHHNTLFGGTALAWMDEVSFIAATRFCRLPLVTVSSDRIDFKHAIPAGSLVELIGRVIKVGNTSLKVEVEVYVEGMYCGGREKAITGVFSFVAIGEDQKPVPVLPDLTRIQGARGRLVHWPAGSIRASRVQPAPGLNGSGSLATCTQPRGSIASNNTARSPCRAW